MHLRGVLTEFIGTDDQARRRMRGIARHPERPCNEDFFHRIAQSKQQRKSRSNKVTKDTKPSHHVGMKVMSPSYT